MASLTTEIKQKVLERLKMAYPKTYRLHPVEKGYMVCRTYIVRRRDYSHGKYPEYAIVRQRSYNNYMRSLFKVRDSIFKLDKYMDSQIGGKNV